MEIGNWIDRQRASVIESGISSAKGVRIQPDSRGIRNLLLNQNLKSKLGKFSPAVDRFSGGLISKTEDFIRSKFEKTKGEVTLPKALSHLGTFNGLATGNKFLVIIPKPDGGDDVNWFLQYGGNNINPYEHFKFVIQSASLPNTEIATNAVESPGPEVLMPYSAMYGDIALEVLCTVGNINEDMHGLPEKRFFDAWMANIIDPYSFEAGYRSDYIIPEIKIQVFGAHNLEVPIMIVSLMNCYPIGIDAVELSHDNNEFIKLNVNIHFERWHYEHNLIDNGPLREPDPAPNEPVADSQNPAKNNIIERASDGFTSRAKSIWNKYAPKPKPKPPLSRLGITGFFG